MKRFRVVLLAGSLLAANVRCSSEHGSSPPTGGIPDCEAQKDCASCIMTDSELCIWCAASASCRIYPAKCESGGGNHGYFDGYTTFKNKPDAAKAVCGLSCSMKGELISELDDGTLNPNACCSSSQPVAAVDASHCAPSFTGEACVFDGDCAEPETCQNGACVGTPATKQVVCDTSGADCRCQIAYSVGPPNQPNCDTSIGSDVVCCAAQGWPVPDNGSGGDCLCRNPVKCEQTAGGGCGCGPDVSIGPGDIGYVASCGGTNCCTNSDHTVCACDGTAMQGQTCEQFYGTGAQKVGSCANSAVGCSSNPPHRQVSSCYTAPKDAGAGDSGQAGGD